MLTFWSLARWNRHCCRCRSCRPSLWATPRARGALVEPDPIHIPCRVRWFPSTECPAPSQHKRCSQLLLESLSGGGLPLCLLPPTRRRRPWASRLKPDEPDEPDEPDDCRTAHDRHLDNVPQIQRQEALVHTPG